MCTAINETSGCHLFGRTLDLEYSYGEKVVITPRHYPFSFLHEGKNSDHCAIIGTAHIVDGKPLYYDAMNEMGLCAAALRFPKLAVYRERIANCRNIASFEVIPWLLCSCKNAAGAKLMLENANITDDDFSPKLPSTSLHWLVGDREQSFVIESVASGVKIYDAPLGVLTNAPDFPSQRAKLDKFGGLAADLRISGEKTTSVPGDTSSVSRFIRAAYVKEHVAEPEDKKEALSRFFHVFDTVGLPKGLAVAADGRPMQTVYTSCMDTEELIYYFTSYYCRRIRAVGMKQSDMQGREIREFPIAADENIGYLN